MSEESSRWYQGRLIFGQFRPFDVDEPDGFECEVGLAGLLAGLVVDVVWFLDSCGDDEVDPRLRGEDDGEDDEVLSRGEP